jgi:hypothetical protein
MVTGTGGGALGASAGLLPAPQEEIKTPLTQIANRLIKFGFIYNNDLRMFNIISSFSKVLINNFPKAVFSALQTLENLINIE